VVACEYFPPPQKKNTTTKSQKINYGGVSERVRMKSINACVLSDLRQNAFEISFQQDLQHRKEVRWVWEKVELLPAMRALAGICCLGKDGETSSLSRSNQQVRYRRGSPNGRWPSAQAGS
jgi:hypothetical protein